MLRRTGLRDWVRKGKDEVKGAFVEKVRKEQKGEGTWEPWV